MSAFIVGPGCINSIVTYINHHAGRFGWLHKQLGYDVTLTEDLSRLASALYLLNRTAVAQRYGEGIAAKDESKSPAFTFRPVRRDPVAVNKAASCLSYQCSEGEVPEQPLFKALESIIDQVANQIVNKLPAYAAAPWGD